MPTKKINPFYATLVITLIGVAWTSFLQNKILAFTDDLGAMVNPVSGGTETASTKVKAVLSVPMAGASISSPLKVAGKAPGNWYFEATLFVKIIDADGTVLGKGPATAEGDWMTKKMVPFSATIPFDASHSTNGFVEIVADDPSGLGNSPSFRVPITFSASAADGATCTSTVAGACAPTSNGHIGS